MYEKMLNDVMSLKLLFGTQKAEVTGGFDDVYYVINDMFTSTG